MIKRFFKLLYVLALIAIGVSFPAYLFASIQFDAIVRTTYRAKCISNNQYVVLQGSPVAYAWEFDEFELNNPSFLTNEYTKETLNFYCKYYDEIQPHIIAYTLTKTRDQEVSANQSYIDFKNSVPAVSSYPVLYKLEEVRSSTHLEVIYMPLINVSAGVVFAFLMLQIVRMCFVYVVYGKVVWHPFRKIGDD
jgi:hypothetical protein